MISERAKIVTFICPACLPDKQALVSYSLIDP